MKRTPLVRRTPLRSSSKPFSRSGVLKERTSAHERFEQRVQKGDGCWLWTGAFFAGRRYGMFWVQGRGTTYAHRFAYQQANGPIPDGMCVCHRCDVPACVNPAHLFLGTEADNRRDMLEKGRGRNGNQFKTHCLRGHAFTPDNTRMEEGRRRCITCRTAQERARYLARRGAA